MKKALLKLIIAMALVVAFMLPSAASAGSDKMAITTSSKQALQHYMTGRDLFERLRFPDARTHLEKAVAADPEFALGYLMLSQSVTTTSDFSKYLNLAKQHMGTATDAEQWWILGVEAGFHGDAATQLEMFQKMAKAHPNDERVRTLLGNLYFGRQEWDNAVAEYEAAVAANPKFSQPYNQLGYSYRFMNRYKEAENVFRKYIAVLPHDPNPYDSYAELLMKTGRFEESIAQYQKALEVDPTFAASYSGIANCQTYLGQYDQARLTADKAFKQAVNDGQRRNACFVKALTYVDQGNLEHAIQQLERQMAIATASKDAASISADLNAIGLLQLEMNEPDLAMASFERSIAIVDQSGLSQQFKDNNRQNFHINAGRVAVAKGDLTTAKDHQAKCQSVASQKSNPFQMWLAHELAGLIAMKEGNFANALSELEKSNLQNTYNLYRMAQCYEKTGDMSQAKKYYDEAANFNQLNAINYCLVRHKSKKKLTSP